MSEQTAKRFIKALEKLETDNDTETMVQLYSENCVVGNVVAPEDYQGSQGAREFWTNYRQTFKQIRSEFRNQIFSDERAALEWTSNGTNGNGEQFSYEGVSILEIEGDKITRFFAYFDPAKLGRQITENR